MSSRLAREVDHAPALSFADRPWQLLGENPFGLKAVCASSWFEARGRRFDVKLPHVAVRDAEIQLEHFVAHG